MILLLGATGYLGQAFAAELRKRGIPFTPLTRRAIDYTRFDVLFNYVRAMKPTFLINAAGFTGSPNIDACETSRAEAIHANTLLPQTVARVCFVTKIPWGHVSSGCIYSGAKVARNGHPEVARDLNNSEVRELFAAHPEYFHGFAETDEPNFSFRSPPCNFYSGTKALAEESLVWFKQTYIWRPRIVFDAWDHPRNFLSKLLRYPKILDGVNSLSHRGDFVRACLDLWERKAPMGTYNIVNPGAVTTRQVTDMLQRILKPSRSFEFWKNDAEFLCAGAQTPRASCILDNSKLAAAGIHLRSAKDALEDALLHWQTKPQTQEWLVPAAEAR